MRIDGTEEEQRIEMQKQLREAGYSTVYGGGSKSKGHGFWLVKNGQALSHDGTSTENPAFWSYADCSLSLAGKKAPLSPIALYIAGKNAGLERAAELIEENSDLTAKGLLSLIRQQWYI